MDFKELFEQTLIRNWDVCTSNFGSGTVMSWWQRLEIIVDKAELEMRVSGNGRVSVLDVDTENTVT